MKTTSFLGVSSKRADTLSAGGCESWRTKHGRKELPRVRSQGWQPRGDTTPMRSVAAGLNTPCARSGVVAERSYLASKVSGGRRKHPTSEASGSGQEELSQVRGLGRPGEATWHLRPGAVTLRSHPSLRPVSAAGRIHPCPRPGQAAGKSNPRRGGCAGTGGPRGAIPH